MLHLDPQLVAAIGALALPVFADFILGVLLALKTSKFSLDKLPGIAESTVVALGAGLTGAVVQSAFSGADAQTASGIVLVIVSTVTASAINDARKKAALLAASFSGSAAGA